MNRHRGKRVAGYATMPFQRRALDPIATRFEDHLVTGDREELEAYDPDVILLADGPPINGLRAYADRRKSIIVGLRHGSVTRYGVPEWEYRLADYVCASRWDVEDFTRADVRPRESFLMTGNPWTDEVFTLPARPPRTERPTILFAPTYNPEISAACYFRDRLVPLIRGVHPESRIIIKPHPAILDHDHAYVTRYRTLFRELVETWREAARRDPRVELIDDSSRPITDFFAEADILVSDGSSLMFEYMVLDRPILLYTTDTRIGIWTYNPDAPGNAWRDIGIEFRSDEEFQQVLRNPFARHQAGPAARQRHYVERLYGEFRDGRSGERVADAVAALPARRSPRPRVEPRARAIAFYLPQFHPIPENDRWWGPGFTEWTNVTRARPLYAGHVQPRLPGELGFYDLRLAEAREAQAKLARAHGIEGFCYWHYWFDGKRLLERPFQEMLASGRPDLPFCLAWANETWTRRWDGQEQEILQAQTYGGDADDRAHFEALLPAFRDPRAIRVDGKPAFLIYRPAHLPDARRTIALWRALAVEAGLPGLHLIAIRTGFELNRPSWTTPEFGFDAELFFQPSFSGAVKPAERPVGTPGEGGVSAPTPRVVDYPTAWPLMSAEAEIVTARPDGYPSVVPSWDNTPRRGNAGFVLDGATPEAYQAWLSREVAALAGRPQDRRLVFINAWNEWAEGNTLEPDQRHGRGYLEATRAALTGQASADDVSVPAVAAPPRESSAVAQQPRWSVMIPTYEPDPVLFKKALHSVLAQALPAEEMEIQVVDDASTGVDLEALVREIAGDRVTVWRQPQNLGFIGNWNTCVDRARGRWIHLLHQDDLVLPRFYELLGAADEAGGSPEAPRPALAFCRHAHIDGTGKPVRVSDLEREDAGIVADFVARIAAMQVIQFASVVVRRDAYEAVGGFDPRAGGAADWEMWVRLAARFPVWYEPEALACYRLHAGSASTRLAADARDTADMGSAIALAARHLPVARRASLGAAARRRYAVSAFERALGMASTGNAAGALAQIREGLRLDHEPVVIDHLIERLADVTVRAPVAAAPAAPPVVKPQALPNLSAAGPAELEAVKTLIAAAREAEASDDDARAGAALVPLRLLRYNLAEALLASPAAQLPARMQGSLGEVWRHLRESPLGDLTPSDEDVASAEGLAAAWAKTEGAARWQLLLAHALFRPAYSFPHSVPLEQAPEALWPLLVEYLLPFPIAFQQSGDAHAYHQHMERWLGLIVAHMREPGPAAQVFRVAAVRVAQHGMFMSLYFNAENTREVLRCRGEILSYVLEQSGAQLNHTFARRAPRRLRVGFLNDVLYPQTEVYSSLPMLEGLDRTRCEVTFFVHQQTDHALEKHARERIDHFVVLPEELAAEVRTLRDADLDILVIGTNVTAVTRKTTMLACHRLARVQLITNSSPVTSGLPFADGYVSGEAAEVSDGAEDFYTETLWRLPGAAHAFSYDLDATPRQVKLTREGVGLPTDAIVFSSGANFYKLVPELLHTWARILAAVPGSILLLHPFSPHWSSRYPVARFRRQVERVLAEHGVASNRLALSTEQLPGRADVKELFSLSDVYLDSFPFAGVNSTVDPLEMAIPVVAWEAAPMRSRMAASLLRELGLPGLIAENEEAYIALAVALARDPARRQTVRDQIRAAMATGPRFLDPRAYGQAFRRLLDEVWNHHVAESNRRDTAPAGQRGHRRVGSRPGR